MSERVFITGIGVISAIGNNVTENLASLLALKTGTGPITTIDTQNKDLSPVCEIRSKNAELATMAGLTDQQQVSRTALLGLIAAKEACSIAKLLPDQLAQASLISANTVGGMDRSEQFFEEVLKNSRRGKLRDLFGHSCGFSTDFIAAQLGIGGFSTTINTACSSSANAIMFGARLIKNKVTNLAITGGTDALTRFTLNGFASLKILSPEVSRPFSKNRSGLNLGEGAGYLVLESETSILRQQKQPICELTGFANTCDAYHQTASSLEGDGSLASMQKALKGANIGNKEVDYINAHGTGTRNNDLSEGHALNRLFRGEIPAFSSTKPYTGHTLGATGGIEAVYSCLSIQEGVIYPNLNWQAPMEELRIFPITELLQKQSLRNVISNSFGFGGNDTSLIFSKC